VFFDNEPNSRFRRKGKERVDYSPLKKKKKKKKTTLSLSKRRSLEDN
jgi:hypothetical protein